MPASSILNTANSLDFPEESAAYALYISWFKQKEKELLSLPRAELQVVFDSVNPHGTEYHVVGDRIMWQTSEENIECNVDLEDNLSLLEDACCEPEDIVEVLLHLEHQARSAIEHESAASAFVESRIANEYVDIFPVELATRGGMRFRADGNALEYCDAETGDWFFLNDIDAEPEDVTKELVHLEAQLLAMRIAAKVQATPPMNPTPN